MDLRIVENYKEGAWQKIDFKHLKKGDIFRMFDAPGVPVIDPEGATDWVCLDDAHYAEKSDSVTENIPDNVLLVNCEAIDILL